MENKIALITDIHSNLEALSSVLLDIKKKKINIIYSLGDIVGLGNHPKECLDLIIQNNITTILGNAEEYIVLGADNFDYLKTRGINRYYNAIWTKKQLTDEQIAYLKKMPHSIELNIGNKKIALCHFPVDVRYDYTGVWKYNGENVKYFFETNTDKDLRKNSESSLLIDNANKDPLFSGKTIDYFDCIIYGHYHFFRKHIVNNVELYSLNGTGVAIKKEAIYYTLEVVDGKILLTENKVNYNYEKLYSDLEKIDYPNKNKFEVYIQKKDNY